MEYAEYKQISDTLAMLERTDRTDFVKDYNETYDRFSYSRDIRLYVVLCELAMYMMSIEDQDKLLFKCQYYLRSPEEWAVLQETFADVVE